MSLQGTAAPRVRSSFAAAFLSSLFPGLGQAYAGLPARGLAFAAAPLLLLSLTAGIVVNQRLHLLGVVLQPEVLVVLLVADGLALAYRVVASVDAWRVAAELNLHTWSEGRRVGRPTRRPNPFSLAGLAAVLLVIFAGHALVAYWDLRVLDVVNTVFGGQEPTLAPGASQAVVSPGTSLAPAPSDTPAPSLPPWNGTDRLNILVVGADQRPPDPTFNTDTMIVVSIDPKTNQVAMLTLPRDTVDVPLPPIPARAVYGATYYGKINSLCTAATSRPDLFPGGCFGTLKQTLGYLYGLNISYYVEVNFWGFESVVDTLGGVTINVQDPVVDDLYPTPDGTHIRLYIPTGVQHMNGSEALAYARSRHGSNDFDRAARQQRVLVALRDQADFATLFANWQSLADELKSSVHTDVPVSELPQLLELASRVDSRHIQSLVFAPPIYQEEILSGDPRGYVIIPYIAKIKAAVDAAINNNPAQASQQAALAKEAARITVLNGSGVAGQAGRTAAYLVSRGLNATASSQAPAQASPPQTVIQVYNGAQARLPQTLALLSQVFWVQPTLVTDPSVSVDIVIVTSSATPALTPVPTLPPGGS